MRGNGLQRVSEAGSAAQLHLDEDEGRTASDDEIELHEAGAVVLALRYLTRQGYTLVERIFTPGAGGPVPQSPTPA